MRWEDMVAEARRKQGKTNAVVTGSKEVAAKSGAEEKGRAPKWDSLVYQARKKQAEKHGKDYAAYLSSNEYKWASENETRKRSGLGLKINNGTIYSFSPLTTSDLKKSIEWADSEIEKRKDAGGHENKVGEAVGKLISYIGIGNDAETIDKASDEIRQLEQDKVVYNRYLSALQDAEDMQLIKSRSAEHLFEDLYNASSLFETSKKQSDNTLSADKTTSSYTGSYSGDTDKAQNNAEHGPGVGGVLSDLFAGESTAARDMDKGNGSAEVNMQKARAELKKRGFSDEEIDRLADLYARKKTGETSEEAFDALSGFIEEHPVIGPALLSVADMAISPVKGVASFLDETFSVAGVHGFDAGAFLDELSSGVTQKIYDKIDNSFENKHIADIMKLGYNAFKSSGESIMAMSTFGKAGEVFLGLNAGMSTYKAGKEKGLSDGEAIASGIAAGLFESIFEHLSLENLRIFQASSDNTLKSFLETAAKQSFTGGMEEVGTDIANEAYDYLVNGGLSAYELALKNGMTAEEYSKRFGLQLVETFATGALSSGGMTAVTGVPSVALKEYADRQENAEKDIAQGYAIDAFEGLRGEVLKDAKNSGVILRNKANSLEKSIAKGIEKGKEGSYYRKIGEINRKVINQQRAKNIDSILSSEEFKSLKRSERNAIRSSVLTHMNNPDIVSKEQRDVLETDNAKNVLTKMQELEYSHMEEGDSKRLEDSGKKAEDAPRTSSDVRKAILKEEAEKLVKNTFEARNADGYTVEAGAVRSITDGEFEVVQDSSGATAKLSELEIADSEAGKLYSELQGAALSKKLPLSVPAVNVALAMYNEVDNTSARAYALWAHDAYKAGKLGLLFSEFEGLYKKDGEIRYLGDITREQLQVMYELGARDIETKPGVTRIGHKGLSKLQAEQVFIIDKLAKKYGLEVVLVDNRLTDGEGRGVNGFYQSGTNRIVLSLQTDMNLLMVVAGHEMFHFLKNQNAAYGKHFQNVVISFLKSDAKYDYDKIYAEMSAQYEGLSEDDILEEITAQYLGVALSDETVVQKIVNEADAKERSFLQKLLSHLKEFISDIKSLLKSYASEDATVRAAMESPVEVLQEIARQFDAALEQVAKEKNPTVSDGGVKASRQFDNAEINNEIISLVNRVKKNNFKPNEIVDFGTVNNKVAAEIMKLTGFDVSDYSVVVEARQIEHILKDHGENGKTDHSLSDAADIAKMGFVLNAPDLLSNAGRTQAYSYMEKGHNRTAKTVLYEKRIGEKSYYVVQAVPITKAKKLFVVTAFIGEQGYKKEASQLINANSPDATTEYGSAILSNNTVPQNAQSVNNSDMQNNKKYSDAGEKAKTAGVSKENAQKTVFGANAESGFVGKGVRHSLTRSKEIGEQSVKKNNKLNKVPQDILSAGIDVMNEMADVMRPYLDKDGILPPDDYKKSTIFKNGSYGRTGENTTVCIRTLAYEYFKDKVSEKLGRPLTVAESLLCSQKIYDIAVDPQCIYCYVAADRKAYDEYLGTYWHAMDKYIKELKKGGDSEALFKEYLAGREPTDKQKKRWAEWREIAEKGKEYISLSNLATKGDRESVKAKGGAFAKQIKDAEAYAQSASWAKKVEDYRAYNGEILKMNEKLIEKLNEEYGFRMYSFSDYTPAFIVENMQMIIDASVRGLKSLAYTKDTDYVRIFAATGQAINVSCYAKFSPEFGTYVEDSKQGASWEETKRLRAEHENVGAVMVCTNDKMVDWALKQDWIDIVIPYHIVKTGTTISNEYDWKNYTADSADKKDGKNANIYPTEHNNDYEKYSEIVENRGITPRFNKWYQKARKGEITSSEYMKLVNEVRLPASKLNAIRPVFDLDAARESFGVDENGRIIEGGFVANGGYMGGWYKNDVDINAEVDIVAADIEAGKSSVDVPYGMNRQAKEKVEKKYDVNFSRQRIGDTWEDIRTKMYESEVHEDIINEIEDYITRLRKRKISRETAITEGLIPKYEAVLKVAREYTKGSDVSARELADVINELMWAAHDGNLDTKQFIATVKIFAENIIKTGHKVNDDLYRQYEEFRRMTREETVHVSQEVYDQYVEEYGSVKNLNRACAGKIKIKPYDNTNRSGRALDDFYGELQELYPEMFKEDVDIYHQLFDILDVWQMIQPQTEYFSDILGIKTEGDLHQQSLLIAEDILSEVLGIKETVKTVADKYADQLKYQQEHYKEYYRNQAEEARRKKKESEEISVLKKRILRNTNHLADMIRNETDQRHIPEVFKEPVMEFLNMVRLVNATGREVLYTGGTLNMVKLERAYMEYYNPKTEGGETAPKYQYDEDVVEWIKELESAFGENADIKKMSLENLEKVDKIVSHFSHIIKHENEIFVNGRREKFVSIANASITEMYNHVRKPEYKAQKKLLDIEHGMLTPIYFFKLIGTTTENGHVNKEVLYKMFKDLQDGQDKWYRNIERVQSDLADIKNKHHYSEAWKRDTTEFSLDSGEKIKLTPEEIMYMRALYIREMKHINNLSHLTEGGVIVENDGKLKSYAEKKAAINETREARKQFDGKKSFSQADIVDGLKKNLTTEDLSKIFASLTDDMLGYSDSVVKMLSTTGAELGNAVSMELFGIRKFTEQNYVPISVASNFIATAMEKRAADTAKLKNRSFTKRTTRDANAAIYVRSLTDIAVDHMQEMSLYNAMTIPIENLTRVFNYQLPTQEEYDKEGNLIKTTGNSFKEIFEAIYGERGLKYMQDFLKDLNGGNQTTARDFTAGMMSRFKKSAVYGSLSVAIQQLSAVVRACAFVDAKYFVPKPYSTKDYEEMIRYNPVAGIKEIGRFDTGLGQTATEWILDEKGGALKKVDDALSFLPGMMDRMTWVYIWNAVKRETAHNTGLKGEALLAEAAVRFRDVIDYTQVYDSTLSRSAMMRDKGTGARMVTMFLAESTLSYNLVRDGIVNAKAAPKQAAKSLSAFVGATLLNAILKSIITAIRKDDEETNYIEVYAAQVVSNFINDINIFNSLPVIKDIMNILSGYDVERPDMTLFSNLYNAAKVLNKEGHTPTWDEILAFLGAVSAMTPIPLNNVIKDVTGIIKTAGGIFASPDFSPDMLGYAFRDMFIGEQDDSVKLYRAIIAGQTDVTERYRQYDEKNVQKYIKEGYIESDAIAKAMATAENNFHNKVIEGLIAEDIRIQEAAEALQGFDYEAYEELIEELTALGFDKNDVIKAIDKYISSTEEKTYTPTGGGNAQMYEYEDLHKAVEAQELKAVKHVVTRLKEAGKEDKNIRSSLTGKFKEVYISYCASGNDNGMQRLKELLLACDVGYTDKTFSEWEKEYLKNKNK